MPTSPSAAVAARPVLGLDREALTEELYRRYACGATRQRWMFLRKKYAWLLVVNGTRLLKRILDIIGASVLLILASPVMLITAIAIKIHDGGPILYVAPRVGRYGREFPFPKFRSMVMDADRILARIQDQNQHRDQRTFKMKQDPRITPVGRIIRKFSIDELPQLWCVLKGDMSLVGPRPPVPKEVALYTLKDRRRLNTTPGITGLWQVSGRSEVAFPEMVELDVQYIQSQSFWLDLKILLKTIPAVLKGEGAY